MKRLERLGSTLRGREDVNPLKFVVRRTHSRIYVAAYDLIRVPVMLATWDRIILRLP